MGLRQQVSATGIEPDQPEAVSPRKRKNTWTINIASLFSPLPATRQTICVPLKRSLVGREGWRKMPKGQTEKLKRSASGNQNEQKLGSRVGILRNHFTAFDALCLFQALFLHIFPVLPLNPF